MVSRRWIKATLVALLLLASMPARSGVIFEAGPTFLSGHSSDGYMILLTERFDKYAIGVGYTSKQYCNCTWPADLEENILIQGQRLFEGKRFGLGLGMAYWQNTNRALGKKMTFSISASYKITARLAIRVRHFSNMGSGAPNLGQDAATISWEFQ